MDDVNKNLGAPRLVEFSFASVILLTIAACDPLPDSEPGRISVQNVDGELLVQTCERIELNSVTLSWTPADSGTEEVAWTADGNATFRAGERLDSTTVPEGLTEVVWTTVDLSRASRVFFHTAYAGRGISVSIQVPEGFKEGDGWLNSDGSTSAEPCHGA